jgi:ribosome-binding protein aMBF1 (putative translation factor)
MESGQLRPTDEVAKRLQKELGISLFEKVESVTQKRTATTSFTLGDMLRDAMDKKKQK